jgi:hypothetical protein
MSTAPVRDKSEATYPLQESFPFFSTAPAEDDEWDLEEPEPAPGRFDPTIGMRRLAVAILLQSVIDFREARDLRVWKDAEAFLFPEDPDRREHFRRTLECSAVDPYWLRKRLVLAREQTPVPQSYSCKNCGPLPASEFRNGDCKKCRRERATLGRREAGMSVRLPSLTRPRAKGRIA